MTAPLKALMSLDEVAEQTPWKVGVIREQVRSGALRAKRGAGGRGQYVVRDVDFLEWRDNLPDA